MPLKSTGHLFPMGTRLWGLPLFSLRSLFLSLRDASEATKPTRSRGVKGTDSTRRAAESQDVQGRTLAPRGNRSCALQEQGCSDTPGQCSHSLTTSSRKWRKYTHFYNNLITAFHHRPKKSLPLTFIYYNSEMICLKDSN